MSGCTAKIVGNMKPAGTEDGYDRTQFAGSPYIQQILIQTVCDVRGAHHLMPDVRAAACCGRQSARGLPVSTGHRWVNRSCFVLRLCGSVTRALHFSNCTEGMLISERELARHSCCKWGNG